jgi:hypothetical protein
MGMTKGHEGVSCTFCAKRVENDNGWAVCETCWYGGVYIKWLIEELDYVELGTSKHRELAQTFLKVTGKPWQGPGTAASAMVIGSWKAHAIANARPEDRERVKVLTR